ncbi:3355_t:CDS:2 [Funneliformis geosporum]|uniref:3355_t:CDS:1 n=1 Tax=Funneliformis geosporum TaxID=1117311 RepID=A0A9W4WUC4_9GLOM|nr:3355_t:CDS:2 [Funneliformis geosporum]
MNGNQLEEYAQEYSVNYTLFPETLNTEVFWDIPEEMQWNDEACLAAVKLLN